MDEVNEIDSILEFDQLISFWKKSKVLFTLSIILSVISSVLFVGNIEPKIVSVVGLTVALPFMLFSGLFVWLLREHPYVKTYEKARDEDEDEDETVEETITVETRTVGADFEEKDITSYEDLNEEKKFKRP
jgi:hypothetical protein